MSQPLRVVRSVGDSGPGPLPAPSPAVVYCEVEDGAVLLSTETEVYYGLNQVGARVWSLLAQTRPDLDTMCAALRQEYPDVDPAALRADVVALLDDLAGAGLVV